MASRILPIKIHDLDAEDKATIENEIGGVLRAIEFIYNELGVNRPLKSTDNKIDNQNKTDYRNQVNKVANAIKEIITALKQPIKISKDAPSTDIRPSESKSTSSKKRIVFASIGLMILVAVIYGVFLFIKSKEESKAIDKSIALLPFVDVSEKHDQAYFTDGMMIEIQDHLFKMKDLRIIPSNSTVKYKDSSKPLREIASELGVAHLIQGSVRKAGNKIKISVSLIDGSTEKYLWQHTYEDDIAEVSKIFIIQSEVASQIANALSVTITPEVNIRMNTFPTKSREAYDLYLKGFESWDNKYLYKAIALDSTFADAYVILGRNYWAIASGSNKAEDWQKSKEYLKKAIGLDPNNSRAYSNLAVVNGLGDWDNKAGRQNLQKAIALNPADVKNYDDVFHYHQRKMDCDSMKMTLQTMKRLQPDSYYLYEVRIKICEGDEQGLNAMHPPSDLGGIGAGPILYEVWRMLILKKYDEVLRQLDAADQSNEDLIRSLKANTYGLMGKTKEAKAEIEKLEKLSITQYVAPGLLAIAYFSVGDESKGYAFLEKGIKEHDSWIHFTPYQPPLYRKRNDLRFQKLMNNRWAN